MKEAITKEMPTAQNIEPVDTDMTAAEARQTVAPKPFRSVLMIPIRLKSRSSGKATNPHAIPM